MFGMTLLKFNNDAVICKYIIADRVVRAANSLRLICTLVILVFLIFIKYKVLCTIIHNTPCIMCYILLCTIVQRKDQWMFDEKKRK